MPATGFGRWIAVLTAVVLVMSSCSSDETTDVTASDESTDSAAPDSAIDPVDVEQLGRSLTGADVTAENTACLIERADGDNQLTEVFVGVGETGYQFTPEAFTALGVAIHSCVEREVLAASLLALSGIDDADAQADFSSCIDDALAEPVDGDLAYVGLAALRVAFPVPEGAAEATIAAGRRCVSRPGLANQFAANSEQASGFTVEVDRDCLAAGIDDAFLDGFWENLVTGSDTGPDLAATIEECSTEYDSGLPTELPEDWVQWAGDGALAGVDPASRNGVFSEPPPMTIDSGSTYEAVLTTGDGEIRISLYADAAPATVNNFVSLAREGYFDGTTFHRVLDGFMAQGGDPTGTGTGGPGYRFDDEETGLTPIDRRGLLAMANSGPDTNGSQFFITFAPATHLDGNHVVFGEVVAGDDVLAAIDLRDPSAPSSRGEPLVSVRIVES